jgi:hypothetical protein
MFCPPFICSVYSVNVFTLIGYTNLACQFYVELAQSMRGLSSERGVHVSLTSLAV